MSAPVLFTTPLKAAVGAKTATALEKAFGYQTVYDLLHHFPRRFEKRGELTDIDSLIEGEHVTVVARIVSAKTRRMRQRHGNVTEVVVTDGTMQLDLAFFGWGMKWDDKIGKDAMFAGKVTRYRSRMQLAQPTVDWLGENTTESQIQRIVSDLIPIYPGNNQMSSAKIERAIEFLLVGIEWEQIEDPLPESLRNSEGLLDMASSYYAVHQPESYGHQGKGMQRMRWQEALALQTVLIQRREKLAQQPARARNPRPGGLVDQLDARLPFELTAGQQHIGEVIRRELASSHPMHRLLQGEVGSGKTVIALRAMLAVVDAGGQAALLAPTEVLAAQHFRSIRDLLGPLAEGGTLAGGSDATGVVLITGSQKAAARRNALLDAASGNAGIVIGTHALLEDKVKFADLGLVVIDEQHRFGVEQRAKLAAKTPDSNRPHILVMTATPIPRTVAITVFGDLDVSTLDELPKGRAGITTHVIPALEKPTHLARAWERIREEVSEGRQAYVVSPRIDDSNSEEDALDLEIEGREESKNAAVSSVEALIKELSEGPLAGLRVVALHGKLPADQKDDIMRRFAAGAAAKDPIDVLVSTTVIEVGVDVPNATVMVVMDADWFGISQLHQLRGRIGRGGRPGLCLLVTNAGPGTPSRDRLDNVASTVDGFELSKLDLIARREGDVLGSNQAGKQTSLRALQLIRDESLVVAARGMAEEIVADDPTLATHKGLRQLTDFYLADSSADWLDRS